tara:strand:- start:216 stop:443 length:228 start_codon:yes stop_codon:yes gene_type:complete
MITLSVILAFGLGVVATVLYLNKKFVTVKELLEDKILVNELLKNEIKSLGKNSRKSAPKNNRRTYRRKPKKQVEK